MSKLTPKQQEKIVRGELMRLMGQMGKDAQPTDGAGDTSLAELGGHSTKGPLPGLGAIDVMSASEDPSVEENDGQLSALVSITQSLSKQIPKIAAAQQTPDQLKAAAAFKRAKELKYLQQEIDLMDPDHKIGDIASLPDDGNQFSVLK